MIELINLRAAFIISGGVFLVSLITGLFGGAAFVTALLRALIFAGVFFGITAGIYYLWNKFLQPGETADLGGNVPAPGGNVDYTVDDDWLGMPESADENIPPENVSAEADGGGSDGGLEPPFMEDSGGSERLHEPPEDADGEVLEQNGDNVYIDSRVPVAGKAAADYAFDMNMSDFMPAVPAVGGGWEADIAVPLSKAERPQTAPDAGMVDISVARGSGNELDAYTDADGKKMAGAIRNLLKKDEG
jgi:hypothetical protein